MSVKLNEYPLTNMNNFGKVCGHLVSFIRKTWNWEGMTPKDWDYRDDDDGREQDQLRREKEARAEFMGPDTGTAGGFSAEVRLTRNQANYDKDQGRDPLQTLVQACIAYGMVIEEERQRRIHIFNTTEQARNYKEKSLPSLAETYIPEEKREEFVEQAYKCFEIFTNNHYSENCGFRYSYDSYNVAKWEGNQEGFLQHQREEYAGISKIVDKIIADKKAGKL